MEVLVCGGRSFMDAQWVWDKLDDLYKLHRITLVVHGGAKGVDTYAGRWAANRGIDCKIYKAEWAKYKKAAGPMRNQEMLAKQDIGMVLAFPGGKGTRNMMETAAKAQVEVRETGWRPRK